MRKIGIEEHFITAEYADFMLSLLNTEGPIPGVTPEDKVEMQGLLGMFSSADGEAPSPLSRLRDVDDGRLKDMDAAGISMQVLSLVPGVQFLGEEAAIEQAEAINTQISRIIEANPERFAGLATLPVQDPSAAAKELDNAVDGLGLAGAMIFSHVKGEYLDDQKYWGIFEVAESLEVPIYIHPRPPSPAMIAPFTVYPELTGAIYGYSVEAGLHAMRLILSGVFDTFPNLQIILGHMGEGLPYWLWRMDKHWRESPTARKLKLAPSEYLKRNFYITTSGMFYLPAFECAYHGLGADRILFAVDYPFESHIEASAFIDSLPIPDEDKEKIAHGNLENLLKL